MLALTESSNPNTMTNKDLAKFILATGAGVVAVTTAAPLLVAAPVIAGIGVYLGWMLSKDDGKKDDDDKEE